MNESITLPKKLEEDIIKRLIDLPYSGYLDVVRRVLSATGYDDVRLLRKGPERNNCGGVDLAGMAESGLLRAPMVAQAKQYSDPVQKRCINELRGVCISSGAIHGVIISTSPFSDSAIAAAGAGSIMRIRLVPGSELAWLMAVHRIGVSVKNGKAAVDAGFFDQYSEIGNLGNPLKRTKTDAGSIKVTVSLEHQT